MGVASLILGIVSIVIAVFFGAFGWIGIIVGVLGIILGALGKKKAAQEGTSTGVATGGLVCSIIGCALCLVFWIACAACVGSLGAFA